MNYLFLAAKFCLRFSSFHRIRTQVKHFDLAILNSNLNLKLHNFNIAVPKFMISTLLKAVLVHLIFVSYPMLRMTHPSRNFFALFLLCAFMQVCKAKSAALRVFSS